MFCLAKASVQLDSQYPEILQQIECLERSKIRKPREEPELMFKKPKFLTPLVGPQELIEGQPAHFECRIEPIGDPEMEYNWYLNGTELLMGSRMVASHDFGYISLDIASTVPEDSGF